MTAKSLLESYLPATLKINEQFSVEEKKANEISLSSSPVKKVNRKDEDSVRPEMSFLSPEEEASFARELLGSTFGEKFSVLDGLSDFLLSVAEKFGKRKWPISLSDVYLR